MREFYPKYWKNEESLASFYIYFFSDSLVEGPLLNQFLYLLSFLIKHQKNTAKWRENTGKVREICQSENVNHVIVTHWFPHF